MFVIVKFIKNKKGVGMPVILLNIHDEILEFNTYEEAELACLRKLIEIVKQTK